MSQFGQNLFSKRLSLSLLLHHCQYYPPRLFKNVMWLLLHFDIFDLFSLASLFAEENEDKLGVVVMGKSLGKGHQGHRLMNVSWKKMCLHLVPMLYVHLMHCMCRVVVSDDFLHQLGQHLSLWDSNTWQIAYLLSWMHFSAWITGPAMDNSRGTNFSVVLNTSVRGTFNVSTESLLDFSCKI